MKTFSEWRAEIKPQKNIANAVSLQAPEIQSGLGGWKASKEEILDHWRMMPSGMPMGQMRSVPPNHQGPTYNFDGLRITGSSQWIDFVLARLKDVLRYETEEGGQTRLQLIYKQIVDNKTQQPVPESFVFYIQVKQRENAGIHLDKPKKTDKIPKIKPLKKIN